MGQALRKATGWRKSPSTLKKSVIESQKPRETRFQDPNLQGHIPGDVYPTTPDPNDLREWDRSDPMYSALVKKMAGTVVTRGGQPQGSMYTRPLPTNRHSTSGPDEDTIVTPGTLNVSHIRQMFLSYQGLAEGEEKPMDAEALAKKYQVDLALLEKVLKFCALPKRKDEFKAGTKDTGSNLNQE